MLPPLLVHTDFLLYLIWDNISNYCEAEKKLDGEFIIITSYAIKFYNLGKIYFKKFSYQDKSIYNLKV